MSRDEKLNTELHNAEIVRVFVFDKRFITLDNEDKG